MEFITVHSYRNIGDHRLYAIDKEILLPIDKIEKIETADTFDKPAYYKEEQQYFKAGTCGSCITTSLKDKNDKTLFVCESHDTIKEMINSGDENRVLGLE